MEAGKRTINDIFNGNRILEIPFFQRSYVWGEPQWERLLNDMENVSNSNKPYFLGSVILKQQPTPTGNQIGDKRTLIDGQQRLTTLNILFKILCLKNNQQGIFDRIFRLLNNQLALLHNHNDIEDFETILSLNELKDIPGHSSIIEAYKYFKNQDLSKIDLNTVLNNIMFVGIDLSVDEDEQQIFDTINSLGVRLTTAELLKNYLFNRDNSDLYTKYWKEVFEKDSETKNFWDRDITTGRTFRENIDLFFYSFLQIKIQDTSIKVKTEDKKLFTRVDGLFDSYKRFITEYQISKEDLIKEIKEYAVIYRDNIDFDVVDRELTDSFGIERINAIIFGLENSTLIPYVLFIMKKVEDLEEQSLIFEYLESYIMRRMVCHLTNKNYNQLFSERLIANNIVTRDALKLLIEGQSDKMNFMPSDDDVRSGFMNEILVNKQATGILYFIETKIRNKNKYSTALLGLNRYSLEHVMPKRWENNWPAVSDETSRSYRNKKLLTLGNLTIITSSLNSSIRDAAWDTKKNGRGDKHGLIHYASSIETFSEYLQKPNWSEAEIIERAEFLYNKAIGLWSHQQVGAM